MANNYVTLTGNLGSPAAHATAVLTPSNWLVDDDNSLVFPPAPVEVELDGNGEFSVSLLATDNGSPQPSGWTWGVEFLVDGIAPHSFSFFLPHSGGGTQDISSLVPVVSATPTISYTTDAIVSPSGDETGATDYAAITAALGSDRPVVLTPGDFWLDAALVLAAGASLAGAGDSLTTITQTSTSASGISGVDLSHITLRGFALVGPGSGTGKGIVFTLSGNSNVPYVDITDVTVRSFGSDGVNIATPIVSTLNRVVSQTNGGNGFTFTGTGTSVAFNACYANHNTGDGYSLTGLRYSSLNGCASDQNANGYNLISCFSVALNGCGTENDTTDGFIVNGGGASSLVSCRVVTNNHYGLHVTGSAVGINIFGFHEVSPGGSASSSIITDSGTKSFIVSPDVVTATSIGGASSNFDGNGNFSIASGASAFLGLTKIFADCRVESAGNGFAAKEGSNCKQGIATLSSGSAVVTNSSVTANSRIFLTAQDGSSSGALRVSARSAGTSFTITSSNGSDGGVVAYEIFEPAA